MNIDIKPSGYHYNKVQNAVTEAITFASDFNQEIMMREALESLYYLTEKQDVPVSGDGWILTYSGKRFYPWEPHEDQICIEDIAHALSIEPRFGGHSKTPYTVGQHSILCAEMAIERGYSAKECLIFLLHDASEAYFKDLPTPLKACLPNYVEMEHKLQRMIYEKFEAAMYDDQWYKENVKVVDVIMFFNEAAQLTVNPSAYGLPNDYPRVTIKKMTQNQIKARFLELFIQLSRKAERGE